VHTEHTCSSFITIEPHDATFDFRELRAARGILFFLVWRDVKVRYRQTLIGVGWTILQPLLAMLVLTAVFGNGARLPSEGVPYPLFAYAGLLAWTFFANAVFSSSNSLVGNAPLMTKVYFPRLVVPLGAVAARLIDFGIAFLLMIALMVYYRAPFTPRLLVLPLLVGVTTLLALACGLWLSALNVRYRDVNVALPHALQFVMFATPVFYSAAILPARLAWMARVNPLAILIEGFRAAFFGRPFHWSALAACTAFSLLLLTSGAVWFRKMEEQFPDLV
jgi:lipopolysaccharide transport system permease protein